MRLKLGDDTWVDANENSNGKIEHLWGCECWICSYKSQKNSLSFHAFSRSEIGTFYRGYDMIVNIHITEEIAAYWGESS